MPCHLLLMIVAMLSATPTLPEAGDMRKIQGQWRLVKVEANGEHRELPEVTVLVDRQLIFLLQDGHKVDPAVFRLGPEKQPKQIDLRAGTRTKLGIYEINGRLLRICFTAAESPSEENRPTDFATPAMGGRVLMEFERIK